MAAVAAARHGVSSGADMVQQRHVEQVFEAVGFEDRFQAPVPQSEARVDTHLLHPVVEPCRERASRQRIARVLPAVDVQMRSLRSPSPDDDERGGGSETRTSELSTPGFELATP